MMTPERWQKVRDVFEQALELAPEKRARFVEVACSSDLSLREEVQSLLASDIAASSRFLEAPPIRSSALTPGTKLGDYEIVAPLGSGGMGVVYRARDLRLGRPVAIKVLREHLAADANRLRRFEQEAQAAAALNHPNILAVYQLGVYQGAPYLVSELLEGETLRDELRRGPMVQARALELGEQIAEGLSAAHQRGIIHRDLKPENLFVSKDGRVKILDFGLAKLLEEKSDAMSTLGVQTNPGMIAGTVAYTSPEQVRGEKLDVRTDLFSFGVVLYEMATGDRPFGGDTSGLIFEAILNRQPEPPAQRNARVAPELERIIGKALEKDREVRYQAAAEIRADLKRLRRDSSSSSSAPDKAAIRPRKPGGAKLRPLVKSLALVALLFGLIIGIWLGYPLVKSLWSAVQTRPVKNLQAQIDPPPLNTFRLTGDNAGPPVISPNAAYVAFTATGKDGKPKLWVRALTSVDARALPDTEGSTFPFWSPDSNALAFFADGKLKTINVMMGSPVTLCNAPAARGGSWNANGEILFTPTPTSPLFLVKVSGGAPWPATKLDGVKDTTHRWPFFLPDQKHFLYFAASHNWFVSGGGVVHYASLDGGEDRPLFSSETNAVFGSGFLVFGSGDSLTARAFDPARGKLLGEAVLLARRAINDPVTWHVDVSASDAGTLVYGGVAAGSRQLVWLDHRTYKQTDIAVDGLSKLFMARVSPQGDRILLEKDTDGYDTSVYDLQSKVTLTTLPKPYRNHFGIWSPDGKWIVYSSPRDGRYDIYQMSVADSHEERVMLGDDKPLLLRDWYDNQLAYVHGDLGTSFDCWILDLKTGKKRKVMEKVDDARLSPDGEWLAYSTRESPAGEKSPGSLRLYVAGLGSRQGKYEISDESGLAPQWSRDGKGFFYLEESTLKLVETKVSFSGGRPSFEEAYRDSPVLLSEAFFDVSGDPKRILIERVPEPTVVVVTNFAEELEKK